jgi:hypothetical protein
MTAGSELESEGQLHASGLLAKVKAMMVAPRMGLKKRVLPSARDDDHNAKHPDHGTSFYGKSTNLQME